jgi:peptidoglycan/LPS O-acetylase OafA/YrhL
LAGVVLFTALSEDGIVIRALRVRWLVFLGEASYSIYLIHAFDQRVWNSIYVRLFGETSSVAMTYFFFFTVMAGIITSGILVYIFVEKPARRWVQKKWIKNYE